MGTVGTVGTVRPVGAVRTVTDADQSTHRRIGQNHIGFDGHITRKVLRTRLLLLFCLQEVRGLLGRHWQFRDLTLTILAH